MAFKDKITSLFARGRRREDQTSDAIDDPAAHEDDELHEDRRTYAPSGIDSPPAVTERERQELLVQLHEGVNHVGQVLNRLDRHLEASVHALQSVSKVQAEIPELLQRQQDLADKMSANVEGNQAAMGALTQALEQRDEARTVMIQRMEDLAKGLDDQRRLDRERLETVITGQRWGRRLVTTMMAIFFLLFLAALVLLLAVVMRLGPFAGIFEPGGDAPPTTSAPPSLEQLDIDRALSRASRSADPVIRRLAEEALTDRR